MLLSLGYTCSQTEQALEKDMGMGMDMRMVKDTKMVLGRHQDPPAKMCI